MCSGIEAATVAWHPLGFEAAAFAEIEKAPSAVLAHHYPNVPNVGDFTKIEGTEHGVIDLLVGGTPCQSFSIAGLRGGLSDERGNLSLEFIKLAYRSNSRWCLWENVPGVLSSSKGADFRAFLHGLTGVDVPVPQKGWKNSGLIVGLDGHFSIAWRVLDAQYFGVPQRRRRVFVVGHLGDWRRAASVLFERESLRWHPAPSREAGKDVAPTTNDGIKGSSGFHRWPADVASTLNAHYGDKWGLEDQHALNGAALFVPSVCPTLRSGGNRTGGDRPPGTDVDTCDSLIAYAIQERAVCENPDAGPGGAGFRADGQAYTLEARTVSQAVAHQMAVRRLTPIECSHLQGFPDDYLELTYGNATEAHTSQILHELWREVGTLAREGWRSGIVTTLLTPEILLAGVHVGWISWEMAARCAGTRRTLSGEIPWTEGFVQSLWINEEHRPSPYKRESFGQQARELRRPLSELPLERAQAAEVLQCSSMWTKAQEKWPLRYALAKTKEGKAIKQADGPRYKMLGNSMAVPCMAYIGQRIRQVDGIKE